MPVRWGCLLGIARGRSFPPRIGSGEAGSSSRGFLHLNSLPSPSWLRKERQLLPLFSHGQEGRPPRLRLTRPEAQRHQQGKTAVALLFLLQYVPQIILVVGHFCMEKKMGEAVARVARRVNETVENKTDSLDLADCKLMTFPIALYKVMRHVTESIHLITLANNELKAVPSKFITTFSQLRELNLEGNFIHHLPEEVRMLSHLRLINLSRNKFHLFPEQLTSLQALETINLEENEIEGNSVKDLSDLWNGEMARPVDTAALEHSLSRSSAKPAPCFSKELAVIKQIRRRLERW